MIVKVITKKNKPKAVKNFIFLIMLIAYCLLPIVAFSQDTIKKPKVGLVLSGGGAKGLAHIGVLKVIDSLNIKIDYIGGTRMGAIVGGLYASGYSAKQLDSIFKTVDVDALLQDYTPRASKSFEEKKQDERYAITLPFNKFKIALPRGLSKGFYNYNLISKLTMHVAHVRDFKELPIPFLCIATEIETGKEVILDKGVLAQALIISGAIPTLYQPFEIDGKLLIDGGVVNNYPVEEIKKRGVNFIIGVDVQDDLRSKKDLEDVTSILAQINNLNTIKKMEEKSKLTNIYIKPSIENFSVISFDKAIQIIDNGKNAALLYIDKIKNNSIQKTKKVIVPKQKDTLFIKEIEIRNASNFTRAYVMGKLRFKPNNYIPYSKIEKGLNNLNATQNYNSILYSFEKANEGEKLILNVNEKNNTQFLKLALHYDGLYKTGVLLNFTKKRTFALNDMFSADIILGDFFRYDINYFIDNGFHFGFGLNSKYNAFTREIKPENYQTNTLFNTSNNFYVNYKEFNNKAYIQTILAQKFLSACGIDLTHLVIKSNSGLVNTKEKNYYLSLYAKTIFDNYDKKHFANNGWYMSAEYRHIFLTSNTNFEPLSIAKADFGLTKKIFKNVCINLQSEGGFNIGERSVPYFDFALGGYGFTQTNNFRPFYGYNFLSISGDSYVKGLVALDYQIYKKNHINFSANYANIGNNIFESNEFISKPKFSGYALGYGYESLIGPLEIKHSWSPETKRHYTWVNIGFTF